MQKDFERYADEILTTIKKRSTPDLLRGFTPEDRTLYPWDDRGMSRLFADVFRDKLRYNTTAKEWYFWTGKQWSKDEGGMHAHGLAKEFADDLIRYCTSIGNEETRTSFLKFVNRYGQLSYRKTLVDDARSEMFITSGELDGHDNLYNCQNGVFDLEEFKLIPHDPELLLSKISNVRYDPDAKSELWERFISDVTECDPEKIRYLQKLFGIALTTDTSIEKMVIIYGPTTRNGKSTLLEIISYMAGGSEGYALSVPPETLAKKNRDSRNASGDLARLDGCRLAIASEPPKRMLFDAALVKTMLGRDTITARHLYEREFQFVPKFTLVMNTNYLPYIQDETLFTSGRIDVVPFNRHFTEKEQDPRIKSKLKARECISAIFNWCLEGLRLYREEGLPPPDSVKAATLDYQQSSDKISMFMDECMMKTGLNSKGGNVYECFAEWCRSNGFEGGSKMSFFADMRSKGLLADGTVNGVTLHNVVIGYELSEDIEKDCPWP